MESSVITLVENGVMTIMINRPKAKNAVNLSVAKGLASAVKELESNSEIHVAILTGAADTFCAGMDLKAFVDGELPVVEGRGFAGLVEKTPDKPLIAAIEGYALAGGFEIAIACDLIVAAIDTKFGIPEVKRGLVAGAGGLVRLPRQIPVRIAKEFAIIGDFFSAQRAYELGLINRVVEKGNALTVAKEIAATIASNGPLAVSATKRVIDESQDWQSTELFRCQEKITDPIFSSEDAIEGAMAFAQKRAPVWKGC